MNPTCMILIIVAVNLIVSILGTRVIIDNQKRIIKSCQLSEVGDG